MKRGLLRCCVAAAIVTFALGCSTGEKAAVVKEESSQSPDEITQESEAPQEEPEETENAAPATAQLGDLVTVGDWDIKITDVTLDAAEQMRKANQFNDKPKGVYVLVTYEATYTGPERTADVWADLTWSFTTTDNQIHNPAGQVTPADTEEWPTEARRGGTVRSQEVFDLDKALVKGGLLTVEGYDESFETVYADFLI